MPTFCRLPCDRTPRLASQVDLQPLGRRGHEGPVHAAAQVGQVAQVLLARQVRVADEVPGEIPQPALHLVALVDDVQSEDARRARGRT